MPFWCTCLPMSAALCRRAGPRLADAHIYVRHVPIVEKMLTQTPAPAPKFAIDPSVTDFYAFTRNSFTMEGYTPAPFEDKIPIAI